MTRQLWFGCGFGKEVRRYFFSEEQKQKTFGLFGLGRQGGYDAGLFADPACGIGAAIAARMAVNQGRVVGVDANEAGLDRLQDKHGVRPCLADVSDAAAVDHAIVDLEAREGRLDGLVSNAAIMIRKPIGELTPAEWAKVIATNLTATYLLVRAAEKLLRASNGSVVTIASARARMSEADTESYAASKGGLVALTHALAISLGPDVRVNAVSPGWIDVKGEALRPEAHAQHPAGRVGRPEDVASLVAWLLSEEQSFVTGSEFVIDGGMTRKMIYSDQAAGV
jgi:NAD(P)-dependent dehydrogenase (short-subunit alcohol dehydrogenase family)